MSLAGADCRCRVEADRGVAERPELGRPEVDGADPERSELDRPEPACGELDRPELGCEAPDSSEPGRSDDSLRPDCSLIDVTISLVP
jgi:hypothetical protein